MSLTGKTVLITRDLLQAGQLRISLEKHGATVISIPTIAIGDPPDWKPFDDCAQKISDFDWIVFTSTNGVIKCLERLEKITVHPELLGNSKIAVVGCQTGKILSEKGIKVDITPKNFQAEALLEELLKIGVKDKKIWFPRALEARTFFIEELEKAGAEVFMTPVYENRIPMENSSALQEVLHSGRVDWVTFTSSSTVHNFVTMLGNEEIKGLSLPKLASIGAITSKSLELYNLPIAFTAYPQNIKGLVSGMLEYEAKHR